MKVFVSWSKEPSKQIAEEVKHLVQMALPGTSVWMSELDIAKGERWSVKVASELDGTNVGIICCTKNNLIEPWLHFEAGALSKSVAEGQVHPLCFGVRFNELPGTLSQFQATNFDRADIIKLLNGIEEKSDKRSKPGEVEARFNRLWDSFAKRINEILANAANDARANAAKSANAKDMPAELTEGERDVLKLFAQSSHQLSVERVGEHLNMHKTRAAHFVSELVSKGYLSVIPKVVADGRSISYRTTSKGDAYAVENDRV